MKSSVLKLDMAFKPETTDAEIDRRYAINDHRAQFLAHARDIEIWSRQMTTNEDGTKRPLRSFHDSVRGLFKRCNAFSDPYDNRGDIHAAAMEIRQHATELLRLDSRISWVSNRVLAAVAQLQAFLEVDLPTATRGPSEERVANPLRWTLLNEIDELSARLMCLGDYQHGGLEERRPVIRQTGDLRRMISNDMFSPVDSSPVISATEAIKTSVARLVNVTSLISGKPGFMQRGMPSVNEQADKIIRLVGRRSLAS